MFQDPKKLEPSVDRVVDNIIMSLRVDETRAEMWNSILSPSNIQFIQECVVDLSSHSEITRESCNNTATRIFEKLQSDPEYDKLISNRGGLLSILLRPLIENFLPHLATTENKVSGTR